HPAIEQPSPTRLFLDLPVWRLLVPRHVSPEDGLVERRRFPNRSGVQAVVEEHHERGSPVASHGDRPFPTAWPLHLVRGEVESIDCGLGKIVPPRHIALLPRPRKPRWRVDQFLFPRP